MKQPLERGADRESCWMSEEHDEAHLACVHLLFKEGIKSPLPECSQGVE
jgi:hypothetical protein